MTETAKRFAAISIYVWVSGCSTPRPDVPRPAGHFDVRSLAGTWHVIESTFPMWLDGQKANPALRYSVVAPYEGGLLLDDEVTYVEGGTNKSIEGVDTPDPDDASHLTWRGKGILKLFKSDWYVVMREREWAVIYFSSTIATPEGVDIIARDRALPDAKIAEIRAAIFAEPSLRRRAEGLRPVRRVITPAR